MRLYSTTDATHISHELGEFDADANGAFLLPDEVSDELIGRPGWETDGERDARLRAEEDAKAQDPASLLAEMKRISEALVHPTEVVPPKPARKPRARKTTAPKASD